MNWRNTIIEPLNDDQAHAVQSTEGPLLVLSGAGSGKTRTIVHRIAWLIHEHQVAPWRIVAVTFTNKAAREMQERALALAGPVAGECVMRTYHSLGLMLLRSLSEYLNMPSNFSIWDDTDQRSTIEAILKNNFKGKYNKNEVRYFVQTIASFKDALISAEELSEEVDLEQYEFGDILEDVYRLYEVRKFQSSAVDFSDLLFQTVKIFEQHPQALEKYHNRYRYFLVDEYQDTNHAQYMLIQLLSQKSRNLCVVGDDDQAIYGWRGADVNNILEFNRDFEDAGVIKLERNYRSTQPVLDLANAIIAANPHRMGKNLYTNIKEGAEPRLLVFLDDRKEADAIAGIIASLDQITPLHEVAVLYRTNSQSRQIEQSLRNQNIAYRVFGGVAFFSRKEIKDMLAYLQIMVNPDDESAFFRLINTPSRGVGDKSVEKLYLYRSQNPEMNFLEVLEQAASAGLSQKVAKTLQELKTWLSELAEKATRKIDLGLLFEEVLDKSGLGAMYAEEDRLSGTSRIENLLELKSSMLAFSSETSGSLADYLQDISLYSSTEEMKDEENMVNLMTIHNAKGLEFDVVFVVGLDDETLPHFFSIRDGNIEEERRLFYVAVTRARQKVFMTRSKTRFVFGSVKQTEPSRFLSEISESLYETTVSQASSASSYSSGGYRAGRATIPGKTRTKTTSPFKNTIDADIAAKAGNSGEAKKFSAGDKVTHPTFGPGRVLRLEGSGDATKIHIFFDDKKSRKFVLKYTKLEKI